MSDHPTGDLSIHHICQFSQQNAKKDSTCGSTGKKIAQQAWKIAQMCLRVFPTMQPWFTKAIDGKTAKGLLFSGVLVLSTDLKVANVILVVIIVNSAQIVTHQNKRLSWYSPSIRSRRQSSHWHPWCILISWGCSWEPPWVKDHELFLNIFIQMAMLLCSSSFLLKKKEILHLCDRAAVVHEGSGHLALVFHLCKNV